MNVTIYHNPRCSKSRETLALLRGRGIEPTIVEYLKDPPDASTLARLLRALNLPPRALLRKGEDAYRDLGLGDPSLDDAGLIDAMVEHPVLIERPIVIVDDNRAAIGRPPERVLDLL